MQFGHNSPLHRNEEVHFHMIHDGSVLVHFATVSNRAADFSTLPVRGNGNVTPL